LLRGDSPVDILRFANAAAALSCMREGALDSVPTRREVEEFLKGKGQKSKGKG
jgi:sugar/nucleoside kinase (ribokinase family)